MSYNQQPRIITEGLALCLDAADPKSYPKSGYGDYLEGIIENF